MEEEPAVVEEPLLTIDLRRQFGRPCIAGTRIPADSIAWSVWADGLDVTMDGYGVTRVQALVACWWLVQALQEPRLRLRRDERALVAHWGEWAVEALTVLGGHREGPCPDPPETS